MIEDMNPIATSPSTPPAGTQDVNKVPEVTLYFWLIKVLCTTVGETRGRLSLHQRSALGRATTTMAATAGLPPTALLASSSRSSATSPGIYWLAVVVDQRVGTQITDKLIDIYDVALEATTIAFVVAILAVDLCRLVRDRTHAVDPLDPHGRREAFYWLAILFTFALGHRRRRPGGRGARRSATAIGRAVRRRYRGRRGRALPLRHQRRAARSGSPTS